MECEGGLPCAFRGAVGRSGLLLRTDQQNTPPVTSMAHDCWYWAETVTAVARPRLPGHGTNVTDGVAVGVGVVVCVAVFDGVALPVGVVLAVRVPVRVVLALGVVVLALGVLVSDDWATAPCVSAASTSAAQRVVTR